MSTYRANITKNAEGSHYALIVRIDADGEQQVIHGYKGRHFKTEAAAIRSTDRYLVVRAAA